MTRGLLATAAFAFVTCIGLGWWVTHHPPVPVDAGGATFGHAHAALALALTDLGYPPVLSAISLGSVVVAALARTSLRFPLAVIVSQLLSQGAVNGLKLVFARPRPAWWLHAREPGFSYPSGHATTAVAFYGAWLLIAWFAPWPLPVRLAVGLVLGLWIAGIGWSRLALGAHYPTDVLGGYLFGAAWLCAATGLANARGLNVFRPAVTVPSTSRL